MFTSVSLVAAMARKRPSRSPGSKPRLSHRIEPSSASSRSSGTASGATSVTSASQARRPSTLSSPTSPPPTTRHGRRESLRQAMYSGVPSMSRTQVWSQIPRRCWQTHSLPA